MTVDWPAVAVIMLLTLLIPVIILKCRCDRIDDQFARHVVGYARRVQELEKSISAVNDNVMQCVERYNNLKADLALLEKATDKLTMKVFQDEPEKPKGRKVVMK